MSSYHRVCCCSTGVCPLLEELPGVIMSVNNTTTFPPVSCPDLSGPFASYRGQSEALWVPDSNTSYTTFFATSSGDEFNGQCVYTRNVSGYQIGSSTGSCGSCTSPPGFCVGELTVNLLHNPSVYPSGWALTASVCCPYLQTCCGGSFGHCEIYIGRTAATGAWGLPGGAPFDIDDFLAGQEYFGPSINVLRLP